MVEIYLVEMVTTYRKGKVQISSVFEKCGSLRNNWEHLITSKFLLINIYVYGNELSTP